MAPEMLYGSGLVMTEFMLGVGATFGEKWGLRRAFRTYSSPQNCPLDGPALQMDSVEAACSLP